jgi:hypothetical protein
MLAAAIEAPKISLAIFAMISSSAVRKRLDYVAANSITLSYNAEQYCAIAWRGAADRGQRRQVTGAFAQAVVA